LFSCRVELASTWLPAKESLARCSLGSRRLLSQLLLGASEIDCEATAIVFFLGLLFGFQRPSRCTTPRLCATVPIPIGSPFNRGGDSFIRGLGACQLRPFGFVLFRFRRSVEPLPLSRRGAASTPLPRSLSTGFGDLFNHHLPTPYFRPVFRSALNRFPSSVRRGRGFYLFSAPPVNRFRRLIQSVRALVLFLLQDSLAAARPFERARLLPPPRFVSTDFVDL
jgi:hypothetical protein